MKSSACLRRMIVVALLLGSALIGRADTSPKWIGTYNTLLAKYVTSSGVKYAAWKNDAADAQAIQNVVNGIASERLSGLSKKEQLAFYLNAYNAWILHEALAKYPTKSVKDLLFTFFTGQRIKVAGEPMSFNHLEKDIIRPKFNEPRIHFGLNCASRSCPPLDRKRFGPINSTRNSSDSQSRSSIRHGAWTIPRKRRRLRSLRSSIGTRTTSNLLAARSLSSTSGAACLCLTTSRSPIRTTTGR